jgi:hypothetical protein
MQSASAEFEAAITAPEKLYVKPTLYADWELDGYGSAGSVDDLTEQVGDDITISHSYDDGMPDAVSSSAASDPTGSMEADLTGNRVYELADLAYVDHYSRTNAGPWGDLEVGGVNWQRTNGIDANFPVSGGTGRIISTDAGVLRYSLADIGNTDATVTTRLQLGIAASATQPVTYWLIGRAVDVSNYYAAHLELLTTGVVMLRLFRRVAGNLESLDSLPAAVEAGTNALSDVWEITLTYKGSNFTATAINVTAGSALVSLTGQDASLTAGSLAGVAVRRETGNTSGSVTTQYEQWQAEVPQYYEANPRQWFSPFNSDSPVATFDRDIAPVKLEHGVVTANGEERVRLFTGQMANVELPAGYARLQGISATRLALAKAVQPPIVNGPREGGNATWLVNWILQECGIYVSPPPRAGTRAWFPMHGSLHPYLPYGHEGTTYQRRRYTAESTYRVDRPTFVSGPYSLAAYAEQATVTTAKQVRIDNIQLTAGEDLLSQASNRGRVEFWVRGDAATADTPLGPLNTVPLIQFAIRGPGSTWVAAEVSSGRSVRLQVHDGISNQVYSPGLVVPTDDAWHAVGMAWNFANDKLWLYLDGTEQSTTALGLTTGSLPATDELDAGTPELYSLLPISDLYFTTGPEANPDLYAWIDEGQSPPTEVVAFEDFEDDSYAVAVGGTWSRFNMTGPDSGAWSLRSAAIAHSGQTDCTITVPAGAATVSFWFKVSSEHGFDYFRFLNNGITQFSISGNEDWEKSADYIVTPGQTLTFRYFKDNTITAGMDAAFIDRVEFRGPGGAPTLFTPQAVTRPIQIEFEALAEPLAREAWELLSAVAKSSITAMRTDELDQLNFLPPDYFVEAAQLAQSEVISTDLNAADPAVTLDPTKIRNSVQVNFEEVRIDTSNIFVLSVTTSISLVKGPSTITFAFPEPVIAIDTSISVVTTFASTAVESVVSFNTLEDGSGAYLTSALVTATVTAWDAGSVTIQFNNASGATAYIVNNAGTQFPFLGIAGLGAHVADASATISDRQVNRSERLLTVTAPFTQRREDAFLLASMVLSRTRKPHPEITIEVDGDPRRQPGDLVELADAHGTKLTGQWRIQAIEHRKRGASYTQSIVLQGISPVVKWDDDETGWDKGVWGP